MLAKVLTGAVVGLEGQLVQVEVDIAPGLPAFKIGATQEGLGLLFAKSHGDERTSRLFGGAELIRSSVDVTVTCSAPAPPPGWHT